MLDGSPTRMIAFLPSIGFQEMFVLLVIGLLLYGRNLPEAGRTLGRAVAHMKRGFQDFKDQMDRDGDLREVKRSFRDSADELRRIAEVPRAVGDPSRVVRDLTNEALSSELPEDDEDLHRRNGADVTSSANDP